ncbi:MAG: CatB-related O-acetyltransferase [Pseudomonadota bacterium]
MTGPDPDQVHPLPLADSVVLLAPLARGRSNVAVGQFTYYDDPVEPTAFFDRNVLYHFDFVGDRLEIGSFCAIATGARFIMNGANHAMTGFSTFPFNIFGGGWEVGFDPKDWQSGYRGDTIIGADVWIGRDALILPGVTIGAGAIIGSGSVVSADVAPYSIVVGNPAQSVRQRFDPGTVATLLELAWWDWPLEKITRNVNAIRGGDLTTLEAAA